MQMNALNSPRFQHILFPLFLAKKYFSFSPTFYLEGSLYPYFSLKYVVPPPLISPVSMLPPPFPPSPWRMLLACKGAAYTCFF